MDFLVQKTGFLKGGFFYQKKGGIVIFNNRLYFRIYKRDSEKSIGFIKFSLPGNILKYLYYIWEKFKKFS